MRNSCIGMGIDAICQPGWIASFARRKPGLIGSFGHGIALEQALVEGCRKGERAVIAYFPMGADKKSRTGANEAVGPATESGQCPALAAYFTCVEEEARTRAMQIAFSGCTNNRIGGKCHIGGQPEGRIAIR